MTRELWHWCLVLLFLQAGGSPSFGQSSWGVRLGLSVRMGTSLQRIGLVAGCSWQFDNGQIQLEWRGHEHLRALGTQIPSLEHQLRLRLSGGWGQRNAKILEGASPLDRWRAAYRLGYQWNWYFDDQQTSQETGTLLVGIHGVDLMLENDALALLHPGDRFRTGAWSLSWQQGPWKWMTRVILWHGATKGAPRQNVLQYPGPFGFKDLRGRLYGDRSHGIWQFSASYHLGFGQTSGLALGYDSERIRHFFQNQLIHDLPFLPRQWNKARNPHYPMLDREGQPYLFFPGQELRRGQLTWEWMLNDGSLY